MRLWSGTQIAYGNDNSGPAVLAIGKALSTTAHSVKDWKLELTKADGTRIWRPLIAGNLERIQVPCPDELAEVLTNAISGLPDQGLHPAISNGLDNEAKRLYPELNPDIAKLFSSYVSYLREHFNLDESKMKSMKMAHYVDGFGPELILNLNGEPVIIPEIPTVWQAPSDWPYATWRVTNGMMGPVIDDSMELEKKLQFIGDFPEPDKALEGLIYFQAARSMLAWAAWEKDKQGRFVQAIASIIMSGHRPIMNRNL